MKKMDHIRIYFIILIMLIVQAACSNTKIINEAVKKQQAALYYYGQNDHNKTEKYCKESIELWKIIIKSNIQSVPKWSIENNISECENILALISTAETLKSSTTIPVRIIRNRIFVNATLNNKEIINLLVDTGATRTVITPEVANRLGYSPEDDAPKHTVTVFGGQTIEVPFISLSNIQVGNAVVNNISAGVYPGHPKDPFFDGVLGVDFLSHFIVTVDHNSSMLTLKPQSGKKEEGEATP